MTHVWQAQKRGRWWLPMMRHPFCRYAYAIRPGRAFEDYGIEQQAEIVRHAFLLKRGAPVKGDPDRGVYEALLPFRRDRKSTRLNYSHSCATRMPSSA